MMKQSSVAKSVARLNSDSRGVSFPVVMVVVLMVGALGVAVLTMSGMENSMAGSMRMLQEGTAAAESCVGTAVDIIKDTMQWGSVQLRFIAPQGPVPAANAALLSAEISSTNANNPDIPVGTGNAPNLIINVNNYVVNGDIDFQFHKNKAGGGLENYYRIDCTAANASTGAMSRVIVDYDCLVAGDGCYRRSY